jgi:hypothetical protein
LNAAPSFEDTNVVVADAGKLRCAVEHPFPLVCEGGSVGEAWGWQC